MITKYFCGDLSSLAPKEVVDKRKRGTANKSYLTGSGKT